MAAEGNLGNFFLQCQLFLYFFCPFDPELLMSNASFWKLKTDAIGHRAQFRRQGGPVPGPHIRRGGGNQWFGRRRAGPAVLFLHGLGIMLPVLRHMPASVVHEHKGCRLCC